MTLCSNVDNDAFQQLQLATIHFSHRQEYPKSWRLPFITDDDFKTYDDVLKSLPRYSNHPKVSIWLYELTFSYI